MATLDSYSNIEAFSNQVEIPGIASIIHEDEVNQATYPNHCELATSGTQTILAVYNDVTTSKGMLRIGTRVSDFAIEWGTAQQFYASAVEHIIPVRLSDTKFAIVFSQQSDNDGYIIAGTVSDTVATLGSAVEFADATTCVTIGANLLATDKVLIAYQNSTTNQRAVCVTFSGTVGTVGATATINSTIDNATYYSYQQLAIHSTTLATVVYRVSATVTECVTLSISGTTITVNTAGKASFGGTADIRFPAIGSLSATAFVVAFTDVTDTNKGNAQIGTIATTTITAGASEYNFDATNNASRVNSVAIISSTNFIVAYQTTAQTGTAHNAFVNGTVITFVSNSTIGGTANNGYPQISSTIRFLPITVQNNKLTFTYLDASNSKRILLGMADVSSYKTTIREMCVKIAEAGATEQIEISSLHFTTSIFSGGGFGGSSAPNANVYYNGTNYNSQLMRVSNNSPYIVGTTTTAAAIFIPLANDPIILKENETLYVAVNANNSTFTSPFISTVFGLKRS